MKNKGFTPLEIPDFKENYNRNSLSKKSQKFLTGFTILEVIAAIFVMTVGVLSAYTAVQQIIVYNSISSSRLTAAYLAQEGIEIVRNIRDTNWLERNINPANPWDEGLTVCAAGCEVDYTTPTIEDPFLVSYDGGRFLNVETATGLYSYGAGASTKFKRKITITVDGADKLKVFIEITWPGNTVTVEEHLYNWY